MENNGKIVLGIDCTFSSSDISLLLYKIIAILPTLIHHEKTIYRGQILKKAIIKAMSKFLKKNYIMPQRKVDNNNSNLPTWESN